MAKTLEQLQQQFKGRLVMRCMGRCNHAAGTCTADKDYQRLCHLQHLKDTTQKETTP